MKKTKYTFLIPAFKARYLPEMLDSILSQQYNDFKVLVSDDCSPDSIKDICLKYSKDSRVSYRRNERNMGATSIVSHWNLIVDLCDTEYLILASDDDLYDPLFLESINKLTEKYPDVDLIRARACRIDTTGVVFEEDPILAEYRDQNQFIYDTFRNDCIHCISNYVFKTDALKRKGKFIDFPLAWFSDDATVHLMAENGVANTSLILFSQRESLINISNPQNNSRIVSTKKIQASMDYYEWVMELFTKIPESDILLEKRQRSYSTEAITNRVLYLIKVYKNELSYKDTRNLYQWLCRTNIINTKEAKNRFWGEYFRKLCRHQLFR